jgi:hypothetical protein
MSVIRMSLPSVWIKFSCTSHGRGRDARGYPPFRAKRRMVSFSVPHCFNDLSWFLVEKMTPYPETVVTL